MKRLLKSLAAACAVALAFYLMMKSKADRAVPPQTSQKTMEIARGDVAAPSEPAIIGDKPQYDILPTKGIAGGVKEESIETSEPISQNRKLAEKNEGLYFRMEDGVAVVDGDIVLGIPQNPGAGMAGAPTDIPLWINGKVPFVIPTELPNPGRVLAAMEQFLGTPIQFTPYGAEEDHIVFVPADKGCKSYVGKVGGQQPIWIGPECSSHEIAHEIMHALGFIHEQNRSDRNRYIRILEDNIQEEFKINFEVFPRSMMKVTGVTPFDYRSIMLYPPTAFSKSGGVTMESADPAQTVAPSRDLSEKDKLRLRAVYGN